MSWRNVYPLDEITYVNRNGRHIDENEEMDIINDEIRNTAMEIKDDDTGLCY